MKTPSKQCQYCGHRSDTYMDRNRRGWYCRTDLACFNRILAQLRAMRAANTRIKQAGARAAGVCSHLSGYEGSILSKDWCAMLSFCFRQWDAAIKESV